MERAKVLGQVFPAGTGWVALYEVPAKKSAVVSSLMMCNQTSGTEGFSLRIAVGGEAESDKQYIYKDKAITATDSPSATLGIGLAAGDVIYVQVASGNTISFHAFGVESL